MLRFNIFIVSKNLEFMIYKRHCALEKGDKSKLDKNINAKIGNKQRSVNKAKAENVYHLAKATNCQKHMCKSHLIYTKILRDFSGC